MVFAVIAERQIVLINNIRMSYGSDNHNGKLREL